MRIPLTGSSRHAASACLALLAALVAGPASATPITVYFTGTVLGIQEGVFAGQGSAVSGSFTYDLDLVASTNLSDLTILAWGSNPGVGFDMTIVNGAVTRNVEDFASEPTYEKTWGFTLQDNQYLDEVQFQGAGQSEVGVPPDDYIDYSFLFTMMLQDTGPRPPIGLAPGSDNLTGEMVDISQLDLSEFEVRIGQVVITGPNPPGPAINLVGNIQFEFDAFSLTPIPEPGTALLVGLGLLGIGLKARL